MRTAAIRFHEHGDASVLRWEQIEVPSPGPGEALVAHRAVGLNYIDIYHRSGLYPVPTLPSGLGLEAAGVIEALGPGVEGLAVGDRVAYASPPVGAYAEARVIAADRLVPLPGDIDDEPAAAMMLQGLTAEYLLRRTYPVKSGETILIHAAAGGVGLIACQWARSLGARVIGTVGSDAKADVAARHGCEFPIVYTREDVVARVREITGGAGLPVVYDSVGRDSFESSLGCLRPRGLLVSFGQASGPVPPLDIGRLSKLGSLYLTRPTLMTYTADRGELMEAATALFDVVRRGAVRIEINQRFPLSAAAEAQLALEGRRTTGSTVLTV